MNPNNAVTQYIHTSWRSTAGLQAVRRIKQTPDGYLWLATRGGLVRFDGIRFSTFTASTDQDLDSSTMQDIVIDSDGTVWVASLGGGVSRYRSGKFTTYTIRDGLPSDDIGSLFRDSTGTLWVGTRDGGIARMIQGRFEPILLQIPPLPITAFAEDKEGSLWISTFGSGVFRLREGKLTPFSELEGIPDPRVSGLYRDRSGKIWTAGWKGLSYWDGTRFRAHREANAVVSYAIACSEDRHGNMWISSSSGLYRTRAGRVDKMDRRSGLSGDFVSDVFEDEEGNLWVATRAGLDRLRDSEVRTFTNPENVTAGPVVRDRSGGIWAVSGNTVTRIAPDSTGAWPLPLPANSTPTTMLTDNDSHLLIGYDQGVIRWNAGRATTIPELRGLDVRSIFRASDGTVWIGTADRGLLRWKSGALEVTDVSDRTISILTEGPTDVIWAGSHLGGGLYRIAGKEVTHFGREEGLRSPNVYSILVDAQRDVWIGSTSGLSWFQDGRIRTVNSEQGLASDQIFAILDDAYGRLWFTGYGGVSVIEKRSLHEWASGHLPRLSPTVYRSAEGLQISTLGRPFPNAVQAADGHLWFSIGDGLSEVMPPPPKESFTSKFSVVLEDVTIDGMRQPDMDGIRMPPGARSVEIRYTALTLSSPETVRFRYRLEGVDRDWVAADNRRVAFYNNLKPGTYTFRVSASTGEEQWREAPAMLLEQLPFFYQTGWFLVLVSVTTLSLIYFLDRLRLQTAVDRIQAGFQERMEERTRIAQELHDTVVQAISGSVMLVENAAEKVPDSLPVVKGSLLRAQDRLDAALAESRAALKGLRGAANLESNLAKQLSDAANEARHSGAEFRLVVTGETRAIRPTIQYEALRIASEAIANAFEHSGANTLRIELDYLNGLRIVVNDDGRGIPDEILREGRDGHFGLAGMRERANRIGGILEVSSRLGVGTRVEVTIPDEVAFEESDRNQPPLRRALSRLLASRHRKHRDSA